MPVSEVKLMKINATFDSILDPRDHVSTIYPGKAIFTFDKQS